MIPLITLLLPLVPSIIQGVENIFGAKQGKKKKDAVVESIAAIIAQARSAGIVGQDGKASDIAEIVEAVVRLMKAQGTLAEADKPETLGGANGRPVQIIGTIIGA